MEKKKELNVMVRAGDLSLKGILGLPSAPSGIVLFAHGSGSGRLSPRNNFVAGVLQEAGIATLLMDLLAESEVQDRDKVFDIDLLAGRLLSAMDWIKSFSDTASLECGYFGASTGAAAALQSAAARPDSVKAIVSRGGRPDLAEEYLPLVKAPTLLIVGGEDRPVISLNKHAFDRMACEKEIRIIPGATHLFEEPGTLETVADMASDWFLEHLR
jgi:putative phosphoribosyl transferase